MEMSPLRPAPTWKLNAGTPAHRKDAWSVPPASGIPGISRVTRSDSSLGIFASHSPKRPPAAENPCMGMKVTGPAP